MNRAGQRMMRVYLLCRRLLDYFSGGNRLHRIRWLMQHFGREGTRRWLINDRKKLEYERLLSARRSLTLRSWNPLVIIWRHVEHWLAQRMCEVRRRREPDAYRPVFLVEDGSVHGMARQLFGRKDRTTCPPWGEAHRPYSITHHPNPRCHRALDGRHGEPIGEDWLAAGFWEKGLEIAFLDATGSRNGIGLFDDNGAFDRAALQNRNRMAEKARKRDSTDIDGTGLGDRPQTLDHSGEASPCQRRPAVNLP